MEQGQGWRRLGGKGNPIRSLAGHVVLFGFRWNSPNETPVNEKRAELSV